MFGMFYARAVAGIGYRPYVMTIDDVDDFAQSFHADPANHGRSLVFAAREPLADSVNFTTPIMQSKTIGAFHESVLVVGHDTVIHNEVNQYEFIRDSGIEGMAVGSRQFHWAGTIPAQLAVPLAENYRYVGSVSDQRVAAVIRKNPLKIPGYPEQLQYARAHNVAKGDAVRRILP